MQKRSQTRKRREFMTRGVLYVIACGCSSAFLTEGLVRQAQADGWDVCLIATPSGRKFLNLPQLATLTGHPVRSEYKQPDEPDLLPRADAIVVFPTSFNTVNVPLVRDLTFIHKLQTELSNEMNAFEQGLHPQPANPQGFPAWRTIMTTSQIPSHAGYGLPEGCHRHARSRYACLGSDDCQQIGRHDLTRRAIRLLAREIAQLQQAYSDRREQTQQPDQAVRCVHQPPLNAAARFEALAVVFHDPATFIPAHVLPGVFDTAGRYRSQQQPFPRLFPPRWLLFHDPATFIPAHVLPGVFDTAGRYRSQQQPFQRLFPPRWLLFPDSDCPQGQWLGAVAFLPARRQDDDFPKGELNHRHASRASMRSRDAEWATVYSFPRTDLLGHILLSDFFRFQAPGTSYSDQKMSLGTLACLKEAKEISSPIPDMHGQRFCWKAAQTADQAHPHIGFSLGSFASLAPRLSNWDRLTHEDFLTGTAQNFPGLRQDGQHRLQQQSTGCSLTDRTQTCHLVMTAEIQLCAILNQQHHRLRFKKFAGVLPVGLYQRLKGHIRLSQQAVQSHHLPPTALLGRKGGRWIGCHMRRCLNCSLAAAAISESASAKSLLRPKGGVHNLFSIHRPILVDRDLCIKVRSETGGFYAVARVGRVPTERALRPRSKMTFADAVSRSSSHPHSQECHRSSNVFLRTIPQLGQICDVLDGSTNTTVRPAHAALTLTICVKVPHPASRMLLFNPAFALAPLGRYLPVSSSCLGAGAFVRFLTCKSSKTMI